MRARAALAAALLASGLALPAAAKISFGEAGDYLRYGAGARALGMGGAFTAVSDDASAEYWNPAGLAYLDEYQLHTMYAPFNLDTNLYYMALGAPLGPRRGTLALSDILLRSDGFQTRDDLNQPTGQSDSVSSNALSLSYGREVFRNLAAGARLRFLQQKVLTDSGNAFAVDLSAYSRPWRGLSAGLSLTNLNQPAITLGDEADEFSRAARLGVAYRAPKDRFILSVDANKTERQDPYYVAGFEFNPISLLSLRAGWDQNQDVTAGVGVSLRHFRFDYAFATQEDLGSTNRVSLTLRWGNIYQTKIEPEDLAPGSDSIYIEGLANEVKFLVDVPNLKVHRWALTLADEDGKPVRSMSAQHAPEGAIVWDMMDDSGRPVKRGLYRYRFTVDYQGDKSWVEQGKFRLDYKTTVVPEVELKMRAPEGIEGAEPETTITPPAPPLPAPADDPNTDPVNP